jgi:hypothetical protein
MLKLRVLVLATIFAFIMMIQPLTASKNIFILFYHANTTMSNGVDCDVEAIRNLFVKNNKARHFFHRNNLLMFCLIVHLVETFK